MKDQNTTRPLSLLSMQPTLDEDTLEFSWVDTSANNLMRRIHWLIVLQLLNEVTQFVGIKLFAIF